LVERAPLRGRAAGCDRRQRSTKPEPRLGRADFQARLDQRFRLAPKTEPWDGLLMRPIQHGRRGRR
jgi:hypothetical protein